MDGEGVFSVGEHLLTEDGLDEAVGEQHQEGRQSADPAHVVESC